MSLTIQNLIDQATGPIYLLNTSSDIVPGGGDVHISVPRKDGSATSITVPKTWLPTEATALVPRGLLVESSNFMTSLARGLVKAISVEEATRLMGRPNAEAERSRLKAQSDAVKLASSAKGIGRNVTISTDETDVQDGSSGSLNNPTVSGKSGVTAKKQLMPAAIHSNGGVINLSDLDGEVADETGLPSEADVEEASAGFRAWVTRINQLSLTDAVSEVQRRGKVSAVEAAYLEAHTSHPKIKAFLQRQMTGA